MNKYKLLVLTDHKNHSSENSLYALVRALAANPLCAEVNIASRAMPENEDFFSGKNAIKLSVIKPSADFAFDKSGKIFQEDIHEEFCSSYDWVFLRMPPPIDSSFLDFLSKNFSEQVIVNDPQGIFKTGSKEFLMNFQDCCPPMRICSSLEDIIDFKKEFPIVLKPFREYGGRGIIRIDGDQVWEGKTEKTFSEFLDQNKNVDIAYLGVRFLKNVNQGDKRIIVVNGEIMGASLRLPAKDSWLCNVAMGGSSNHTTVDLDEINIVKTIHPILSKLGIVMYGVDTLVNDDGKRVLSEINTTSIGGLPQIAKMRKEPLVEKASDLIWDYFLKNKKKC